MRVHDPQRDGFRSIARQGEMTIEGGDDLVEQGSTVRHRLGAWHDLPDGALMSGAAIALVTGMFVEPADWQLALLRRLLGRQAVPKQTDLGLFRALGFT